VSLVSKKSADLPSGGVTDQGERLASRMCSGWWQLIDRLGAVPRHQQPTAGPAVEGERVYVEAGVMSA
jgi:hypothetical protein